MKTLKLLLTRPAPITGGGAKSKLSSVIGCAALPWLLCLMAGEAAATVLMGPVTNASNGHLYYLLAPTNWTVAQFEAMRLGGNLAAVNDASENTWISQTFGHYGGLARNLWIGLGNADRDGVFSWASGEPLTYTNWAAGEPNRYGGTEFYGSIANWGTTWNDLPDLPGPSYGTEAVPYGVVEVVPPVRLPCFGDEINIRGFTRTGSLTWTNGYTNSGRYSVEFAPTPIGPWQTVPGATNIQSVASLVTLQLASPSGNSSFYRVHWLDCPPVDLKPPFRFVEDAFWVSPNQTAQLAVVDALGRVVPSSNLVFGVTGYWSQSPDTTLAVDSGGVVRVVGTLGSAFTAFRCLATYRGLPTANQAFVVGYPQDDTRQVFKTAEWRLFLPTEWITTAVGQFPDFGQALDVGRIAQKQLVRWTYAETWNLVDANRPAVPWESIAEDPNTCAYNGNPIGFSRGCFFGGLDGGPWWPAIFHELGHNSLSLADGIMYGLLTYGAGLYNEGDANLLGRWSGQVLLANSTIQAATKTSIQRQFDDIRLTCTNRLAQWETESTPLDDRNGDPLWEGIHLKIAEQFGTAYFQRYVRAWRNDNNIRDMLAGANPPGDWYTRVTMQQRATFMAAAVSAAVRQDLRSQFRAWRFPVVDTLFQSLFDYLQTAMNNPL